MIGRSERVTPGGKSIRFPVALALLLALAAVAGAAEAGERPSIRFYCWRERALPPAVRDLASGPDYLPVTQWSTDRGAPRVIDVALDAGSRVSGRASGDRVRLRVRVRLKVSRFRIDAQTGRPDYAGMHRLARWSPLVTKTILLRGFDPGERIHLVSELPLGSMRDEMWQRDEWPLELSVDVLITPAAPAKARAARIAASLPVIGADRGLAGRPLP
jgi:hypothetical protein